MGVTAAGGGNRVKNFGGWLLAMVLAAGLHLIVAYGFLYGRMADAPLLAAPLVVEATLMAPPPAPATTSPAKQRRAARLPPPRPRRARRLRRSRRLLARRPSLPLPVVAAASSIPVATPAPAAPSPPAARATAPAPPLWKPPRFQAAYLHNPPPRYPLMARRSGDQGTALLRVAVSAQGGCTQAVVKRSSGYIILDRAALAAVRQWRFVPAKRGRHAVAAWVEVPITFRLNR